MSRSHWMFLTIVVGVALVWWVATQEPGVEPDDATAEPTAAQPPPEAPVAPPAAPSTAPAAPAEPPSEPPAAANPEVPAKPSAEQRDVPIPAPERSGPVDEMKQAFEHEPRASSGTRFEAAIETQFRRPEVPPGLLKSVICRTTVCRVETRWSPERAEGFMSAFMHLVADPSGAPTMFDSKLAISPEADVGPDGSQPIDVYLKRAEPTAAPAQ